MTVTAVSAPARPINIRPPKIIPFGSEVPPVAVASAKPCQDNPDAGGDFVAPPSSVVLAATFVLGCAVPLLQELVRGWSRWSAEVVAAATGHSARGRG